MEARVYALVVATPFEVEGTGFESPKLAMVAMHSEKVDNYRDEREVSAALRRMADEVWNGTGFVGVAVDVSRLP